MTQQNANWNDSLESISQFAASQEQFLLSSTDIPPPIILSFADHLICRIEHLPRASFFSTQRQDVHVFLKFVSQSILDKISSWNQYNSQFQPNDVANGKLANSVDLDSRMIVLERMSLLRARISRITDLMEKIIQEELQLQEQPQPKISTKLDLDMLASQAESGIKQAIVTVNIAYSELLSGNNFCTDEEKLSVAEQCIDHISQEVLDWYSRLSKSSNSTDSVILHYQASSIISSFKLQIQECLTDMQIKIVDSVIIPSTPFGEPNKLRDKRKSVNKRISQFSDG
ncbi:hypothetical protein HK096_007458, partial [Nowakowskiella sp. JEL0078]